MRCLLDVARGAGIVPIFARQLAPIDDVLRWVLTVTPVLQRRFRSSEGNGELACRLSCTNTACQAPPTTNV